MQERRSQMQDKPIFIWFGGVLFQATVEMWTATIKRSIDSAG